MNKFLLKTVLFLSPITIFYWVSSIYIIPSIYSRTLSPSTESLVRDGFRLAADAKEIDMVVLGNSTLFRGINPSLLDISTHNLGHDNDFYTHMYYKLKWFEEKHSDKKIKYLILGVNYFNFSYIAVTRNYLYKHYLGKEFLYVFKNGKDVSSGALDDFLQKTNILEFNRIISLMKYFEERPSNFPYIKENGQYIVTEGKALPTDTSDYLFKYEPIEVASFKKILNHCRINGIKVFIVMPPTRKVARSTFTNIQMENFDKFINSFTNENVHFFNYKDANYTIDDYIDITHLNVNAADRFTKELNSKIMTVLKSNSCGNKPGFKCTNLTNAQSKN